MRLIELRWAVALVLYCVSLAIPGLHLADGTREFGWVILVFGWVVGILIAELAWFANPVFLIGIILLSSGQKRSAGLLGLAALVLGALSYRARSWTSTEGVTEIVALGAGFYVWMLAFVILASSLVPWPSSAIGDDRVSADR